MRRASELVEVIEAAWDRHERSARNGKLSPRVFTRNGEKIKDLRGASKSACKEAGVPGVLIHDHRRSALRTSHAPTPHPF